jgi:hypothetical protein
MYTIEKRSYGLQVTVDSALQPEEIEVLTKELKLSLTHSKRPYEPLGIFVRPSSNASFTLKPRIYVVD